MRRFFIDNINSIPGELDLPLEESRHINLVLRLKPGDRIVLFDAQGNRFLAEILKGNSQAITVTVLEELLKSPPLPKTILAQGLLKADHMDLIVQKAVELGATEVMPFVSTRSVAKYVDHKAEGRIKRWERIIKEAAKQCGYPGLARIHKPLNFQSVIGSLTPETLGIILWEEEKTTGLKRVFEELHPDDAVILVVGPEGGLTSDEVNYAIEAGFRAASLGELILRSETAAIASLAALQFHRGRMGDL
jgi:16S rRNA (uracil1498-N3)-methyltransferase